MISNRIPSRTLPWWQWAIIFIVTAVVIGTSIAVWRSATGAPSPAVDTAAQGATQTSEGGQVTITATWNGTSAGPVFQIVMDTHAVDLDSYDLTQLATLRLDSAAPLQPSSWDAPAGGHHRAGTLRFPALVADKPVIDSDTRVIELVIRDVAGVPERTLRWTR